VTLRCYPFADFLGLEKKLSDEQRLVLTSVRSVIDKHCSPRIARSFLDEEFPMDVIKPLAEAGTLGCNVDIPGRPALDPVTYGLVMRELERCDSGLRSFASVQGGLVMFPIAKFGSEQQKQKWLPKLASGEVIGCFGLTESHGGSDPGAMRTKADRVNDKWILNGSKTWITNGNLAEIAVVWAMTMDGVRGFIVPLKRSGVTVKKMTGKLSLRASVTSELFFDKVELDDSDMLPASTAGLRCPLECLSQARYGIGWGVLGAAEACFDEVCKYVEDRTLFGEALAGKQLIQAKLARMLTKISLGQNLAWQVAHLKNEHELHFAQISMLKQSNVEMALEVSRTCRDILGANGIMAEYQSMRHMCNLETVYTYEGTNDVHLLIIGQQITGIAAF
jgi:glutaryl-CoA dehydrogenase